MKIQKIHDSLNKLSQLCGLDDAVDKNCSNSDSIEDMVASQTGGAESFAKYLSYQYFNSETELFSNDENIVGFMLQIYPIVGAKDDLLKNLNLFFNKDLPEDSFLQFLLVADHDISPILSHWERVRTSPNPLLQKLTKARRDFLLKASTNFKGSDGRLPRDFQIFISFSKKIEVPRGFNRVSKSSSKGRGSVDLKAIEDFKALFIAKLDSFKLSAKVCTAPDLIRLVRGLVQMNETSMETKSPKYNIYNSLSQQILKPLEKIQLTKDSIISDRGFVTKTYYVAELPDEFSLQRMINLIGSSSSASNTAINARFAISYTIASNLNVATQAALTTKGDRVIHASEQWYSRNNRDIKREAAEWRDINDLHKNGSQFLTENFQVMISAKADEIDSAEQNLISLYNIQDWKLEINKNLQLISLLSMLPMQQPLYFQTLKHFQLTKIVLSHEVVAKLPVHAEWKGVPMPGVLLFGRRGQLFNWNPFHRISSGNYNTCLMAASGGGKSVFLQELATTMLAQGAKVFILDIGGSYANICDLLNGEMVRFKNNANISLNPFASICQTGDQLNSASEIEIIQIGKYRVARDSLIYAKSIVAAMCSVTGNSSKEPIIEQAINKGIEKHGHDLDITKLAEVLTNDFKKNAEIAQVLATSLFSYTASGIYGRYFNGDGNISFKNQLTVFEFEEIKNDSLFLSVILQVIMMQIFMQVLCGDRKTKFMMIVDEAWMILGHSAKFLSELARTVRKYNGSLVTCVQNFNDFNGSDDRKAILENSTWSLLLKQDEKGLSAFKSSEAFKDIIPLIESVSLAPGKYAEILLHATDIAVVGRLALDPYSQSLFSTDASDFRYLAEAKELGLSQDEAVERLASHKYGHITRK